MPITIKKAVRIPFMAPQRLVDRIDKYAATKPNMSRAEAMRELMENGLDLPDIIVDLLDALDLEGMLYYENIAKPVRQLEEMFGFTDQDVTFAQITKEPLDGKPYAKVKETIDRAQREIDAANVKASTRRSKIAAAGTKKTTKK